MKNTIIKFLIATLILPVFLAVTPTGMASEIHGIQHERFRDAGAQHAHAVGTPTGHSHAAFTHDISIQHPVFLDLNTYFSDYLNVDLRTLPDCVVDIDEASVDVWSLHPSDSSCYLLKGYAKAPCVSTHEGTPHLRERPNLAIIPNAISRA